MDHLQQAKELDFVSDLMATAMAVCAQFTADHAKELERRLVANWGGDRPYIGKLGKEARNMTSLRNMAIIRDFKAGERIPFLSRRYGLSKVRVWQIIQGCR